MSESISLTFTTLWMNKNMDTYYQIQKIYWNSQHDFCYQIFNTFRWTNLLFLLSVMNIKWNSIFISCILPHPTENRSNILKKSFSNRISIRLPIYQKQILFNNLLLLIDLHEFQLEMQWKLEYFKGNAMQQFNMKYSFFNYQTKMLRLY